MKTERYGAYQLEISDQDFRLHYKWTRNDYLETSLRFCLGIFLLSINILLLITIFNTDEFSFWQLIVFLLISLVSLGYFTDLFSWIRKPTKNILYLDMNNATLKIRTRKRDLSFAIKDLKSLEYTLEHRTQRIRYGLSTEYSVVPVFLWTKTHGKEKLLTITENATLPPKSFIFEQDGLKLAQSLTKRLAGLMNIKSVRI